MRVCVSNNRTDAVDRLLIDFKAMDDIGVVMTPFGDVVTVILVVNRYED